MRRSLAGALLALMLAAALICPAWGEDFRPLLENRPLTAGDSVSDWLAIASGRAGLQRPDYLRDLESYVTSMYRENGGLDRIKATEWHRITLAVLAQGGDPTAFGRDREGKPIDLVAEGTYNWSRSRSLGAQGLNGWIFALITLDSGGFAVPEGAAYTREDMIAAILAAQTEEGAFGLSAGTADVDITAMALQALAPYQEDAATAEAIRRGLAWLSGQQTENGDFVSWGDPNAESTAQVLIALCSLGLDPETDPRFIRNGRTFRDGLLSYRTREGLFRHTAARGPDGHRAGHSGPAGPGPAPGRPGAAVRPAGYPPGGLCKRLPPSLAHRRGGGPGGGGHCHHRYKKEETRMYEITRNVLAEVKKSIVGKDDVISKVWIALLAEGHVLLEDVPGVGKTTMALAFSRALGLDTKRIQFTPDTMPSDIIGFSMPGKDGMVYQPGAIMTNLLLADEINRTSSKTQSALLEAMEEGQVTVDRVTHPLPRPFAVLATQNPVGSAGTQDLPNSQLDRFLMKLSMGYPDLQSQIHILRDRSGEDPLTRVQAVADRDALCEAIRRVRAIHIADPVYDYIARLTEATRSHPMVRLGISPRGALALCRCAKAAAFAAGRDFVLPEDAAELVPYVFGHRLMLSSRAKLNDYTPEAILAQVLEETPAPAMTERTL